MPIWHVQVDTISLQSTAKEFVSFWNSRYSARHVRAPADRRPIRRSRKDLRKCPQPGTNFFAGLCTNTNFTRPITKILKSSDNEFKWFDQAAAGHEFWCFSRCPKVISVANKHVPEWLNDGRTDGRTDETPPPFPLSDRLEKHSHALFTPSVICRRCCLSVSVLVRTAVQCSECEIDGATERTAPQRRGQSVREWYPAVFSLCHAVSEPLLALWPIVWKTLQ